MRNPGTEPLQITTNDVVELHKQLEAERLAHAAEVAGLRAALEQIHKGACLTAQESRSRDDDRYCLADVIKVSRAALAAEPGPLAAAVKQMATVLGERHAETCQSILLDCDCKLGHRQRAALAAYRAALGGNDEPR